MENSDKKDIIKSKLAISSVMNTEVGRLFVWEILCDCGVYQDIAGEDHVVQRALGRREIGLRLLGKITDVDEDKIFMMMREASQRQKEQEADHGRDSKRKPSDRDILAGANPDDEYHESGDDWSTDYGGAII